MQIAVLGVGEFDLPGLGQIHRVNVAVAAHPAAEGRVILQGQEIGRPNGPPGAVAVELVERAGAIIVEPLGDLPIAVNHQAGGDQQKHAAQRRDEALAERLHPVQGHHGQQRGQKHRRRPAPRHGQQPGKQRHGQGRDRRQILRRERTGGGRFAKGVGVGGFLGLQAPSHQPDERPQSQGHQVGEVVLIDVGPHHGVVGVAERVLVDPDELAVARQILHDSEHGLHRHRHADPTQQPLDVPHAPQPLHGHQKQHPVGQEQRQAGPRRGRRHRHPVPGAQAADNIAIARPEREQLMGVGRKDAEQRLGQRAQLNHHQRDRRQQKPFGPRAIDPHGASLEGSLAQPGHADHDRQRDQHQLAQRMTAPHEPGTGQRHGDQSGVDDAPATGSRPPPAAELPPRRRTRRVFQVWC